MPDQPQIAIAGVTGAVGQEMLACLEARQFPVGALKPLASARSAGKTVRFRPQIKKKGGAVDWKDDDTQLNAGAWFLRKGDKVRVKIGKAAGKAVEAVIIVRQ